MAHQFCPQQTLHVAKSASISTFVTQELITYSFHSMPFCPSLLCSQSTLFHFFKISRLAVVPKNSCHFSACDVQHYCLFLPLLYAKASIFIISIVSSSLLLCIISLYIISSNRLPALSKHNIVSIRTMPPCTIVPLQLDHIYSKYMLLFNYVRNNIVQKLPCQRVVCLFCGCI